MNIFRKIKAFSFYGLGKWIYRFRWLVISFWGLLLLACIPFLPDIISPFKTTGFIDETSKSAQSEKYLNKKLGYINYNKFLVMYHSKSLQASSSAYTDKIKKSLSKLKDFPIKNEIIYPDENKNQISKDKHTAYAVVVLKTQEKISDAMLDEFMATIKKPSGMTMQIGGESVFEDQVNKQTQTDLFKADMIATPAALITLLLVFGSAIAAIVPIFLGGVCAVIILTGLYFLGHAFTLSVFTLNIALLLGLCLSLDYSLFIISRFREELIKEKTVADAVAVTQETAGHAILFSGLAVFASLSALLFFPVNVLFSIGVGGLMAVLISVLIAIVLLPAVLSVIGHGINRFSLPFSRKPKEKGTGFWHRLGERVVNHPKIYMIFTVMILVLLAWPVSFAKFGVSDFRIFPQNSEHRLFFDTYAKKFNENELNPILLVIETKNKTPITSKANIAKLYDIADQLKENDLIKKIYGIVTTNDTLNKMQYYALYHLNKKYMNSSVKKLLATTTNDYLTVFTILSKYPVNSDNTKALVEDLQTLPPKKNIQYQLTGKPVSNIDLLNGISNVLPYAILWIMISTYIILLLLLRSVVLPIKAIVMNILSLSACYGALVLVFQDGYLHHFLDFEPQAMLDISLLVIIFCALFGFSMDYEVFLLSRIREACDITTNNNDCIIFGMEKSSKIITSAAAIVIVICFCFLVADVVMVKAFGLGIAVAIFVDAFLIRTLLTPAVMTILGKWNWYIPRWLDKILPKV